MRLIRLELANYRRFEEVEVEFPDGVLGIIGNNGAGKSSLVEAIAWALYGNDVARSSKEEIKRLGASPSEPCRVILDFELHGENYRVVRELKGISHTADASFFLNGKPQARGVTAASDSIHKTLGMDWKSFLISFFARQKELNALSEYQPAKRVEVLSRMLGIERIETAIRKLRQDKRDCQTKLDTTKGFMVDINQLQQQIQLKQQQQNELIQKVNAQQAGQKAQQAEFSKLTSEFELLKSRKEIFNRLQKELDVNQSQVKFLAEQSALLQQEKEEILNLIPLQDELKSFVDKHTQLTEKVREQDNLKHKASTRKSLSEQINAHRNLSTQDENRLQGLQTDLSKKQDLELSFQDNARKLTQLEGEIEECQEHYNHVAADEKSLTDQIKKLQQQLVRIEELGPESVCDRCLRPLGNDFDQIRGHIREESEKLQQQAKGLAEKKEIHFKAIKQAKPEREKLQKQKELYQGKLKQLEQIEKEIHNLHQRLQQSRTNLENFQKAYQELGDQPYQPEVHQRLLEEQKTAEQKKQEYLQVSERIKALPQLEKKIRETDARRTQLQQSISETTAKLNQLAFDESLYRYKEIEVEQKRNSLHLQELELKDLHFSQTTIQQEIKQIEEKIKENQLFQKQIAQLEEQRKYLEKLDLIMSEFKLHLIGRIRPALSALSKSLMSEMTEGKYSELEVDQDYEIFIYDNGAKFGLERFSGGEKDLANLCLRLAISLLISQSGGTDFSFIVLDEIFGSQDQQRKENILKALGNLRNRFRQIILITHIDDIKDQVESLINVVENQDGTSRIETSLVYD